MSAGLGDLFKQIIDSEQKAQEIKDCINKLKSEYNACCEQIKTFEKNLHETKAQLLLKRTELTSQELEERWLGTRLGIMCSEREQATTLRTNVLQQLEKVKHKLSSSKDQFCRQVREFTGAYDLVSNGHIQRENQARLRLDAVKQQQQKVETELSEYAAGEEKVRSLQEERGDWQRHIALAKRRLKKAETELESECKVSGELSSEKQRVAKIPQTDPNFKRVHHELDACRKESMESVCMALQNDLQALQQKKWQQDLQKKRELQQQQRIAYDKARAQREAKQNPVPSRNAKVFSNFKSASTLVQQGQNTNAPITGRHANPKSSAATAVTTSSSNSQPIAGSDINQGSSSQPMKTSQTNSHNSFSYNSQEDDNTLEFSSDFELTDGILLAADSVAEQQKSVMMKGFSNKPWNAHQQNMTDTRSTTPSTSKRFMFKPIVSDTPPSSSSTPAQFRQKTPNSQPRIRQFQSTITPPASKPGILKSQTPPASSYQFRSKSGRKTPTNTAGGHRNSNSQSDLVSDAGPPNKQVRFTASGGRHADNGKSGSHNQGFSMFVNNSQENDSQDSNPV